MATVPRYNQAATYNYNPPTQSGSGAFGAVPGVLQPVTAVTATQAPAVGMPDPFGDLAKLYPNLSGTDARVASTIASQLAGQLSPETVGAIQDAMARFGVSSGMPGSGLSTNLGVRSMGQTAEQLQQQGVTNFGNILPMIKATQTVSPELQASIGEFNAGQTNNMNQFNAGVGNQVNALNLGVAEQNALNAAAPNPTEAASYAKQLFDQYLQSIKGPGGGTVNGGMGMTMPTNPTTNWMGIGGGGIGTGYTSLYDYTGGRNPLSGGGYSYWES